ncbi:hypothetical protein GCM10009715_10590 [Paeniglutamicibacter psychrophenolicus]|uniref:Tail sheath protein C-terminal domain-containing protein n=1 Tax=Paeniglutamicibacter psychrophenolicus TaxID=257454 RepID=A0ABS4WHZ0_9MICC|nr:phage tail sheath C-terminal domain-containing protein [Paeniglutamicibacter psychrophenolicus]MBP2375159.1 hypothetical protein [Paeniglutamicibacter psychrophenolicus]
MAPTPLAPGLYRQPLAPIRAPGRLARGDVPAMCGYAVRGPVNAPARIYSMAQFEAVFGPSTGYGHLWHALKGFFETGGRAAYVLRIATGATGTAATALPAAGNLLWKARASFPWPMIDPRKLAGLDAAEAAGWLQVFERQLAREGARSDDPGSWGNGLSLRIARTALARTETIIDSVARGPASLLRSLAGIEASSVLELTQQHGPSLHRVLAVPAGIQRERSVVRWDSESVLDGFDPARPIRVGSVEFEVQVFLDAVPVQRFAALAPHPGHSLALVPTLQSQCRDLALLPVPRLPVPGGWIEAAGEQGAALLARVDWADPRNWPPEGTVALTGGTDGLEQVGAMHWLAALRRVAELPDAALVACPDAVLAATLPPPIATLAAEPVDCRDLSERPTSRLVGQVLGIGPDGRIHPVAGVDVDAAGPGGRAVTGTDGGFVLDPVSAGVLALRLRHREYAPLDVPAQSSAFHDTDPVLFTLSRLSSPAPLGEEALLTVQLAMSDPAVVGGYKMALLDPPGPEDEVDELLGWAARLGDCPRGIFNAPWLLLPDAAGGRPCPPCGHVAGAYAAAELAGGIHHSGANRPLRYVQGAALAIDDQRQGLLNPAGVNAVRIFPGAGLRLYGTRTLAGEPQWQFTTVRRLVDAIEKSIERILAPIVFEPNHQFTRNYVASTVETFLGRLHRAGALAGPTPEASFRVRSDTANNPPGQRDAGVLLVEVDIAPTVPYEFITFRIGHAYDALSITEES